MDFIAKVSFYATLRLLCALPLVVAVDMAWLAQKTSSILESCRVNTTDGSHTVLFTPNGDKPYYVGQWMRDSYYGFSSAWDLVPNQTQALASAAYLLARPNAAGIMPQMVNPAGKGSYAQNGAPLALDSGPFAALMLAFFSDGLGSHLDGAGLSFFKQHSSAVLGGMNAIPLKNGMPWSDPALPHVGYGFTDTIVKTSNAFYSSVLYWQAALDLERLFTKVGDPVNAEDMHSRAQRVASGISKFWNATDGMFRADLGAEHSRIDVWGSALACVPDMRLGTAAQCEAVAQYLSEHASAVFLRGQVREVPLPDLWLHEFQKKPPFTPGYQNGGYWATPLHHVLPVLATHSHSQACQLLNEAIDDYKTNGIWEWVLGTASNDKDPRVDYGAPAYVASAANSYRAAQLLNCA